MSKKGGYVIVDLKGQSITAGTPFTLDGVTARLDRAKNKACLLSGFAIGNDEKRDVFVDLQKTEDGYIALFGQYTMTIEDDEVTITNGGVLTDNIVDSQGNKRFIEGDLTEQTAITNGTIKYKKWSLSGTHLMVVIAVEATTAGENLVIPNGVLFKLDVPNYIYSKLVPVYSNVIASNTTNCAHATSSSATVELRVTQTANVPNIISNSTYTVVPSGNDVKPTFRIKFDFLIDTVE